VLFSSVLRENFRYLILGAAIILAMGLYSCSTRYEVTFDKQFSRTIVVDRWTGEVTVRH
jgi:hypothetical protein